MPVILVLKASFAFQVASFFSSLILIVSPLLLPVTFFLLPARKQTPKRMVHSNIAFRHLCLLQNKDTYRNADADDSDDDDGAEQKEYQTIGPMQHELELEKMLHERSSLKRMVCMYM